MAEKADTYDVGESDDMRRKDGVDQSRTDTANQLPVLSAKKKHKRYLVCDKLRAVTMSESGMGSIAIGEQMGIESSVIRGWVRKYRKYGIDGLRPASYGKGTPPVVMTNGDERNLEGESESLKYGFVRYVDNAALMRSMIGRLLSYGIRQKNIEVWKNFIDFLKTVNDGGTIVVNSLFDIATDISSLITTINSLSLSNITVISLEDGGAAILPEETKSGALLQLLHNYVKVADIDAVTSVGRASAQAVEEPDDEPVTKKENVDERFAKAYEIWCKGGSMASAARASGCSYSSFRYWIRKDRRQRLGQT